MKPIGEARLFHNRLVFWVVNSCSSVATARAMHESMRNNYRPRDHAETRTISIAIDA